MISDSIEFTMKTMELLDRLESRIEEMLGQIHNLRQENERLKEELGSSESLAEEVASLKAELDKEKAAKEAIADRINTLLERLTRESR